MNSKVFVLNTTIAILVLLFFVTILSSSILLTMVYLPSIGKNFAKEALIASALMSGLVTIVFSIKVLGSLHCKICLHLMAKSASDNK
jgi:hypothetical protein